MQQSTLTAETRFVQRHFKETPLQFNLFYKLQIIPKRKVLKMYLLQSLPYWHKIKEEFTDKRFCSTNITTIYTISQIYAPPHNQFVRCNFIISLIELFISENICTRNIA
jgi:hypothetical protein